MVNTTNSKKSNKIISDEGLAFDDVLLVPQYSEILPSQVSLATNLTRNTVLQQAATSMLAQANAQKNSILALIQQ